MATKKPKGLGMGLEALLGPACDGRPGAGGGDRPTASRTPWPVDRLQAGRYQPRTRMDEGALYELAESIKAQGVMQPVLVRPVHGVDAAGVRSASRSSPANGAFALRGWPAWSRCRCSSATSPTKPPRRWR